MPKNRMSVIEEAGVYRQVLNQHRGYRYVLVMVNCCLLILYIFLCLRKPSTIWVEGPSIPAQSEAIWPEGRFKIFK